MLRDVSQQCTRDVTSQGSTGRAVKTENQDLLALAPESNCLIRGCLELRVFRPAAYLSLRQRRGYLVYVPLDIRGKLPVNLFCDVIDLGLSVQASLRKRFKTGGQSVGEVSMYSAVFL